MTAASRLPVPRIAGISVAFLALALVVPLPERKGDDRVSDLAAVGVLAVQVGEVVSIGPASTEGIGDELAPLRHIHHRGSCGATHVGNVARARIEGVQYPARHGGRRVELSV